MSSFGSEERTLLNDSARQYFESEYSFARFAEHSAQHGGAGWNQQVWRECAKLGWLGVAVSDEAGGAGGGMTELAIVVAAAGRQLALEPWCATCAVALYLLEQAQGEAAGAQLQLAMNGELTPVLCHYEPHGGYARDYVKTVAVAEGDNFVLNGAKTFALHAGHADRLVLTARIGDAAGSLCVLSVPADAAGLRRTAGAALDGRHGASVTLTNVACPRAALLYEPGPDTEAHVQRALDRGALANAAEAAGAMAAVSEQTVEYLKNRQQFGKPLTSFQVLQHRLVDMSMQSEETRAVVMRALVAMDCDAENVQEIVWQTKMLTSRAAQAVGAEAVQLHGGMGMTDELAIGHYYKRLLVCASQYGDADWYAGQLSA